MRSRLHQELDSVRARCDITSRLEQDPVGAVHRFTDPLDQEIVALVASSIAFGNVKTIRAKLDDALERLGPSPAQIADDEQDTFLRMKGWIHRVFIGEDIARLMIGARRVQRANGSLGERFRKDYAATSDLKESLARFCDALRKEGGFERSAKRTRRGPAHLLPDPRGLSGSKRLLLFLRWMIRPADGVDLGLWDLPSSILLCPVDTHIHKIARNLGFTQRPDVSWKTAEEITSALAKFDSSDPVKYDFSLCHMGMLQRCPSARDESKCHGCGVKPVCLHWRK